MEEFHISGGLHIKIEKHIPVAAGMAGGSTNGAAVLYGINRICELGLTTVSYTHLDVYKRQI